MLLISKNSPLGYWALILRNKRKATSPTQVQDWAPLFPGAGPRRVSASHLEPGLDYFSGSCGGFNKRVEVTYLASGRPFLNIRPFPVTLPKAWITETGSAWWLEGPWWRGKCKPLPDSYDRRHGRAREHELRQQQSYAHLRTQTWISSQESPAYRGPLLKGRRLHFVKTTECLVLSLRF